MATNWLEALVQKIMDMQEASEYIESNKETWGLDYAPLPESLKEAAAKGRLEAVKKSGLWFTDKQAVEKYMKNYNPKHRERRAVARKAETGAVEI